MIKQLKFTKKIATYSHYQNLEAVEVYSSAKEPHSQTKVKHYLQSKISPTKEKGGA